MKRRLHLQLAAEAIAAALVVGGAGVAIAASPAGSPNLPAPPVPIAHTSTHAAYASGRVVVKFERGVRAAAQARLERANHAQVTGAIRDVGATVLKVPAGAETRVVSALQRSGKVVYAERDGLGRVAAVTPNDSYWSSESTQANYVNLPTAWSTTTGSSTVTVGVLDSGITYGLPDLGQNLVPGYDFVGNDSDPTDPSSPSHGTEVAGIIGADTNNATGVAGVCWSCRVMPVRVCDASGNCSWSAVASGITWATDNGARVINLSLSGSASSSALQSAVTYAEQHGVLVVAAAGNSGCNCPTYPASLAGVISVAAVTTTGTLQSYSNYGPWVDIAAPANDWTTWSNGSYQPMGGTSASTPVVSGIAALAFSASSAATASSVMNALQASATPIGPSVAWGAANAAGTVQLLTGAPSPSPSPSVSASPSASPSPSPSPTSPSPSPSSTTTSVPTATPVTQTFSGTFTNKTTSATFLVSCATTSITAQATYTKANSLTVSVSSKGVAVGTATGASPVTVTGSVNGTATVAVGGTARTTYSLNVTC